MNKLEYEEIKRTLAEVNAALKIDDLTNEQRQQFQTLSLRLSGALSSVWFPVSFIRRFIMLILFAIGIFGVFSAYKILIVCLFICCSFSPRLMGEIAVLLGRFTR